MTAGAIAGAVVSLDLRQLYLHQRQLIGSTMHTPDHFRQLVRLAREGSVQPQVGPTFPLTEIHRAQAAFLAKTTAGRVVVIP